MTRTVSFDHIHGGWSCKGVIKGVDHVGYIAGLLGLAVEDSNVVERLQTALTSDQEKLISLPRRGESSSFFPLEALAGVIWVV